MTGSETLLLEKLTKLERRLANLERLEFGSGSGSGDMLKSVYDTDDDGQVDAAADADTLDGSHGSEFAASAHNHTESDITDLEHNAIKIWGVDVPTPVSGDDQKALVYDHGSGEFIYSQVNPIQWVFADAAERLAATGFTSADLSKFAWQQDDNSIWMLVLTSHPVPEMMWSKVSSYAIFVGEEVLPVSKTIEFQSTGFSVIESGSKFIIVNSNADQVDGYDAEDFAPAGEGVANGDSHDHSGGDGAQIDHGGLSGLGEDDHPQYAKIASMGLGVRLYCDTAQTFATGTFTAITFNTVLQDDGDFYDNGNPTKITIPADGWYHIGGNLSYVANATGVRDLAIRIDGGSTLAIFNRFAAPTDSGRGAGVSVDCIYYFEEGQYIELMARQYSGGNLNSVITAYSSPAFWCIPLFSL